MIWLKQRKPLFSSCLPFRGVYGLAKTIGNMRQVIVRGLEKVDQMFELTMVAYNLTRMRSLGQLRPEAAQ